MEGAPEPRGSTAVRVRKRWPRRLVLAFAGLIAAYLALAVHPQPLFAYTLQRGNLVLHAREPLPAEVTPMLDDALGRVSRSPLYDAARTYDVFLCGTSRLYDFFALWNYKSG